MLISFLGMQTISLFTPTPPLGTQLAAQVHSPGAIAKNLQITIKMHEKYYGGKPQRETDWQKAA